MIFKEEDINTEEIKKILDVYFDTTDENYRKGLMEITPFEGAPFKKRIHKVISYFGIRRVLKHNKNAFIYRLALITGIKTSNKEFVYLKGIADGEAKLFFSISRRSIKSKKNIYIDKMISIERGLGEKAIKDLCDYYNIYSIVVQPSVYGIGFWSKMQERCKGKINITIQT